MRRCCARDLARPTGKKTGRSPKTRSLPSAPVRRPLPPSTWACWWIEGRLDWDKPLRDFLPTFRLHDPVATERITPRDIVSHRVGLPRHDLMWYNAPLTRHEIFDHLRYLEPNKDIRQTFQYQNLMFLTAGVLIQHLSGQTWEEFTRQRIFDPLNMRRSNFSVANSQRSDDFAMPYHEKKDQVERIPFRNINSVGPAGSINSCVADMLPWLRVHTSGGMLGERPILSAGNLSQMHTPQMIIQETRRWKELLNPSYGLGWFIQPYRGYGMVQHGGNIDGFSAMTAFLPAERIGVVALVNLDGSSLPYTLALRVFDLLLGLEPVDWNERFHQDYLTIKAGEDKSKEKSVEERQAGHPPAHPLEDYAGEYEHPGYGVIAITCADGKLAASYNNNPYQVEPYHYDIFEFIYEEIDLRAKGSFWTDEQGNVSRLALPLEPSVKDIVFERIPERRMRERTFLERLVGRYDIMGAPFLVALKGDDRLAANFPGQPASELRTLTRDHLPAKRDERRAPDLPAAGCRPGRGSGARPAWGGPDGQAVGRLRKTRRQVVVWCYEAANGAADEFLRIYEQAAGQPVATWDCGSWPRPPGRWSNWKNG